jgi:hypothetical protein
VYYDDETGRVHDFCTRRHANEAIESGEWAQPGGYVGRGDSSQQKCALYGCSRPVWVDPTNNIEFDYCSRGHADKARAKGELPAADPGISRAFKGVGLRGVGTWSINLLNNTHPKYAQVKQQFYDKWMKTKTDAGATQTPRLLRVYQIRNPAEVFDRYDMYKEQVGGENRRFHGTSAKCSVGVDQNQPPCDDLECAVCNICRAGFSMEKAVSGATNRGWARFGPGLYFSPVSGKSNDYNEGTERRCARCNVRSTRCLTLETFSWLRRCCLCRTTQGNLKSMFLCKVAVGTTWTSRTDMLDLTPDDVRASVAPHAELSLSAQCSR